MQLHQCQGEGGRLPLIWWPHSLLESNVILYAMVKFTQRQHSGKIFCLMCQENGLSENHSQGQVIIVNASVVVVIDVGKEASEVYAIFWVFDAAVPYPD